MEQKLLISGSSGKTYIGFLGCWQVVYVRQMKLFNLMNCRELTRRLSWTSSKSHGPFFLIETVYLLLTKISASATKKDTLPCIKHTECDMDWRIKLKVFKKIVDEFRTENITKRLFVENYFHKKIYQIFIYIVFIFVWNLISKAMKKYYMGPFYTLKGVPGSNFQTLIRVLGSYF